MDPSPHIQPWSLLILARHAPRAASSRLRTHQFLPYFEAEGAKVTSSSFFDEQYLQHLYEARGRRPGDVLAAYARRLRAVLSARSHDILLIEKELFPYLPGAVEGLVGLTGRPWVLDYDDATFHTYDRHRQTVVRCLLGNKLAPLIRGASLTFAGNSYLSSHIQKHGARRVVLQPTVVDIHRYQHTASPHPASPLRVGWIGTPETTKYLPLVFGALAKLHQTTPVHLVTIGAGPIRNTPFPVEQHPWSLESEARLLSTIHVGIMPLPDEPWERGKCGYKLIQYMACGRPVIASPVGVNIDLINTDVGMLATSDEDWFNALRLLGESSSTREAMGLAGRKLVEECYSLQAVGPRFARLVADVALRRSTTL